MADGYYKMQRTAGPRRARRTAPSGWSTLRWRSTTRTAIKCPSTSFSATPPTPRAAEAASTGAQRTRSHGAGTRTSSSGPTTPISLQHFADSAVRAYEIAMTPPRLPVVLVADSMLQQRRACGVPLVIPRLACRVHRVAIQRPSATRARRLVQAENPVDPGRPSREISRRPAPHGGACRTLQAGVIDEAWRLNFLDPTSIERGASATGRRLVGRRRARPGAGRLLFGTVHRIRGRTRVMAEPLTRPGAPMIRVGVSGS